MTKFYICTKEVAKGPYQLHEVDTLNIDRDDLIWSDEYGENRKAIKVPELRAYFKKKAAGIITSTRQHSGSLVKNAILGVLLCLLVGMVVYYFTTY
ncbi:MAG TPA: hypothetical protein PLY34_08855 [Ferruginibacter sp.]|nr:hypothetical protein [Ferruginibacter sp.]HPH90202.1 hypothetical protein [Ferruginibacter sp.]